jgi:hypothetical protein
MPLPSLSMTRREALVLRHLAKRLQPLEAPLEVVGRAPLSTLLEAI